MGGCCTRSPWLCWALGLWAVGLQATAYAALPWTYARGHEFGALAPAYRLNGHPFVVPAAAMQEVGPAGVFVSATATSLHAALTAAGYRERSQNRPFAARLFAQDVQASGHFGDSIWVWRLGDNRDGPGDVYFVRLVHKGVAHANGQDRQTVRLDSEAMLHGIFLSGTSRLAVAMPMAGALRPLPWIRLRHAASELQLAAAPLVTPAADAPDAAVQVVSLAQGDLRAEQDSCLAPPPAPPPGPVCAAHGAFPLRPLSADDMVHAVVWHAEENGKKLALTFDACSTFAIGRFNPRVIAALRAQQVPATLFVGGHWAEMYPDVLEELAQDPLFEIGNHTYSHPHMRELSVEQQRQELLWTQELIFERTGKVPALFRPPYGEVDDQLITTAAANGLFTIEYDLPAGDADDHVTQVRLANWVVGRSTPGSIVVMHMCRPNGHTADALPAIVAQLRAQGYVFCQVSDLLFHGGQACR